MATLPSTSRFRDAASWSRRRWWLVCAAACALVAEADCFLGDDSTTAADASAEAACDDTLPTDCTTVPSYASAIAPLMSQHCVPCHSSGGVASDRDLTTYANIEKIESTALSQVYSCAMPPGASLRARHVIADFLNRSVTVIVQRPNTT